VVPEPRPKESSPPAEPTAPVAPESAPEWVEVDSAPELEPVTRPEPEPVVEPEPAPELEEVPPAAGRIERLRGRLAKSRSALGQGLLGLLGAGDLDEDSWEDVEDMLLIADLGAATAMEIVETLRTELSSRGVRTEEQAQALLREVLI